MWTEGVCKWYALVNDDTKLAVDSLRRLVVSFPWMFGFTRRSQNCCGDRGLLLDSKSSLFFFVYDFPLSLFYSCVSPCLLVHFSFASFPLLSFCPSEGESFRRLSCLRLVSPCLFPPCLLCLVSIILS